MDLSWEMSQYTAGTDPRHGWTSLQCVFSQRMDPSQYTGGTDPCHASMSLQNFGTERGQKIDVSMKMEAK